MAMLGELKGIQSYPCPMCGSPVYSSALQCPSCGTDLTRAGAIFSSSGTSVEVKPKRDPRLFAAFLMVVAALGVAAGTVGRPWVESFAGPGITVAGAAVERVFRSVRQQFRQLPGIVRRANKSRTANTVRPAVKATPANVPNRPLKPAASVKPVAVAPAPVPAATSLTISSTPRGARVQIDGVARGLTPVTIKDLRAGAYKVRVSHQGFAPVTRTIRLESGKKVALGVTLPVQAPPKVAAPVARPAAPPKVTAALVEVGRVAPQFAAKDRVGIIYRPADYRGRKLLLVFVQNLDRNAQRIIRELNVHYGTGARGAAVVIVLHPDRAQIRQFTQSQQIQIPVLFGSPSVARAYGVGAQPVLYLVAEDGRVALRQVGRVTPSAVPN